MNEGPSTPDEKPKWPKPKIGGNLRHKFTKQEDETLKRIVQQHGEGNWSIIASCMKNRTARQCRERYKNYLSPNIKNDPWSPEEELLLEEKYAELGPRWAKIALYFENRSDVNVKNHWTAMTNRQNREKMLDQSREEPHQPHLVSLIPIYPTNQMIQIPQAALYQQLPMQSIQAIQVSSYPRMAPIGVPPSMYQYNPNMFPQGNMPPVVQQSVPPYKGSNVAVTSRAEAHHPTHKIARLVESANQPMNQQIEPPKANEIHPVNVDIRDEDFQDLDFSFNFDASFDETFDIFNF
ncbi:Myb-like DNA-binding domain containing protein [Histomonas meleagridis]|uniref:Myb-like DNA-binding domain containing protein n=1 Tax=Histomonas meleagridis TaxID=135588 RepID=UPI0035597224|nr:Myb-like DNA-binding domain containing protein [Histomonas meleagridis]KAH0799180.1 Myb-like DNA-binding domain containing protein [Histomonas meleagridis]